MPGTAFWAWHRFLGVSARNAASSAFRPSRVRFDATWESGFGDLFVRLVGGS
ncbi:MAG: hypothetical protein GY719_30480 [bacterium]|nr:hypothetical protein [bacterium]